MNVPAEQMRGAGVANSRTQFQSQRRDIMQTWACYLDQLRMVADVIPGPQRAA